MVCSASGLPRLRAVSREESFEIIFSSPPCHLDILWTLFTLIFLVSLIFILWEHPAGSSHSFFFQPLFTLTFLFHFNPPWSPWYLLRLVVTLISLVSCLDIAVVSDYLPLFSLYYIHMLSSSNSLSWIHSSASFSFFPTFVDVLTHFPPAKSVIFITFAIFAQGQNSWQCLLEKTEIIIIIIVFRGYRLSLMIKCESSW